MKYAMTLNGILAFTIIGLLLSATSYIISEKRFNWHTAFTVLAFHGGWSLLVFLFGDTESPAKMLLMIFVELVSCWVAYGFHGSQMLLKTFIVLICSFGGDIIAGMFMLAAFDSQTIATARAMAAPITILLQIVTGGSMVLLALLYRGVSALMKARLRRNRIGYLLRPMALLLIVGALFARAMMNLSGEDQVERLKQVLPDFIFIVLLLAIGITYITQDIRFYRQAKENQQLHHQQSLQSLLLQDIRIFRHNISNMLYGMEGTLLSGDVSAIEAYYHQMIAECQRINNENVVALKRVPSLAVSSLLLNKLREANEQKIPFFITVQEDIDWHGLRDSDMTQVLGILIDNALEAAETSSAPYVAFEAQNVNGALSLTVRNTFQGEPPVFDQMQSSTKFGHEGLGLHSLRKIAKHNPGVLFNIYTVGRYVEASLICY